jgi:hypothetical protein
MEICHLWADVSRRKDGSLKSHLPLPNMPIFSQAKLKICNQRRCSLAKTLLPQCLCLSLLRLHPYFLKSKPQAQNPPICMLGTIIHTQTTHALLLKRNQWQRTSVAAAHMRLHGLFDLAHHPNTQLCLPVCTCQKENPL